MKARTPERLALEPVVEDVEHRQQALARILARPSTSCTNQLKNRSSSRCRQEATRLSLDRKYL